MTMIFANGCASRLASASFTLAMTMVTVTSGLSASAQSINAATTSLPAAEEDKPIAAGDDFDRYVNGAWAGSKALAQDSDRWTARGEIAGVTRERIDQVVRRSATLPHGTSGRKVSDYVQAYEDEDAIEQHGLVGIRPLLERISGVHTRSDLSRLLGAELKADVDPVNASAYDSASLFGLSVAPDTDGHRRNGAYLLQGGLGLVDRDYYVASQPQA